jgi:AcrR family transcriptional regulator
MGLPEHHTQTARAPDRGVARRQAFLQAAREVFLEQGYEAASVNDVVRKAGGSLATLYAQFGSKEGLFVAVIQDQHERFSKAMTPQSVDGLPLEEGLQQIGERFLRGLLAPENLAFYRIMVGEVRKFPHHLQKYSGAGADRVRNVVDDFVKASGVKLSDEDRELSYLLEIWRSRHHYRALVEESYVVSEEELHLHVADGVRFFLRAVR